MPSTEVALFHMSEVVRSVASPVGDEDEESLEESKNSISELQ